MRFLPYLFISSALILIGCGKDVKDYTGPVASISGEEQVREVATPVGLKLSCDENTSCPEGIVAIQQQRPGEKRSCTGFFINENEILTHSECIGEVSCLDLDIMGLDSEQNQKAYNCQEIRRDFQKEPLFTRILIKEKFEASLLINEDSLFAENSPSESFYFYSFVQKAHDRIVLSKFENCSSKNTNLLRLHEDIQLLHRCKSSEQNLGSPVFNQVGDFLGMISHTGSARDLFPSLSYKTQLEFVPTIVLRKRCLIGSETCGVPSIHPHSIFENSESYQQLAKKVAQQFDGDHGEELFRWQLSSDLRLAPSCIKKTDELYREMRRDQTFNERISGIKRLKTSFKFASFRIERTIDQNLEIKLERFVLQDGAKTNKTVVDLDFDTYKQDGRVWIRLTTYGVRVYTQRVFRVSSCDA